MNVTFYMKELKTPAFKKDYLKLIKKAFAKCLFLQDLHLDLLFRECPFSPEIPNMEADFEPCGFALVQSGIVGLHVPRL